MVPGCHRTILPRSHPGTAPGLATGGTEYRTDVIVGDDMFFGVLPMLLGSQSKRPPIVLCDGAPNFLGLPPATTEAERLQYADIARDFNEGVDQPALLRLNKELGSFDVGPLTAPTPFPFRGRLAAAYMQFSAPPSNIRSRYRPRCISSALLRSFQVSRRCRPGA